jgi:uncharacterized repeat protein (TIGR01451 family)
MKLCEVKKARPFLCRRDGGSKLPHRHVRHGQKKRSKAVLAFFATIVTLTMAIFCFLGQADSSMAQTEIPFAINKTAFPNPVIAGQELIYIITLKNVSDEPQTNIAIIDNLPKEVELLYTDHEGSAWAAASINDGHTVLWMPLQPIPPGAESEHRIVVRVQENTKEPLINDDYGVGTRELAILLRGQALTTNVIQPTPIPLPTERPTRLPTATPTATLTPAWTPTSVTSTATSPASPTAVLARITATTLPMPTSTVQVTGKAMQPPLPLWPSLTMVAAALVLIALIIRHFRRRRA